LHIKSGVNKSTRKSDVMREALVIVDMQYAFVNDHTKHLIEKIYNFTKQGNFTTVVGTKYVNHENSPCYKFEGWKRCMRDDEYTNVVNCLSTLCDKVFEKDVYSCWNDELTSYLELLEIDRVVFVGVNTGCCVLHSAFDSYNDLFETVVISDLCGSTSGKQSHECALQILRECITKERVLFTDEYLFSRTTGLMREMEDR
jgi:nicotinamidase-related amidase